MKRFILCLLPCLLGWACVASAASAKRPNILFIYAEDISYLTSERTAREPNARIAGLKTPNLDAQIGRASCRERVCYAV